MGGGLGLHLQSAVRWRDEKHTDQGSMEEERGEDEEQCRSEEGWRERTGLNGGHVQ